MQQVAACAELAQSAVQCSYFERAFGRWIQRRQTSLECAGKAQFIALAQHDHEPPPSVRHSNFVESVRLDESLGNTEQCLYSTLYGCSRLQLVLSLWPENAYGKKRKNLLAQQAMIVCVR